MMVPLRFGRYEVVEELGRGSQGVVYLALDRDLDRRVALKVMPQLQAADAAERARFLRGASAAARVEHRGLCSPHDVGEERGVPYCAMPYLSGSTLAQLQTEEPEQVRHGAAAIGEQVARALHAAHLSGVVHRDVKPSNILIQEDGTAVLLDFGSAYLEHGSTLTRSGELLGTPAYLAPELIVGGQPEGCSDVYALGVVLYECLTGRRPFSGATLDGMFTAVLEEDAPEALELQPGLDPALAVVVERCLEKRPADRPVTALALAEELVRVQRGEAVISRRRSRWRGWLRRNGGRLIVYSLVAVLVAEGSLASWLGIELVRSRELHSQVLANRERNAVLEARYRVLDTDDKLDELERRAAQLWPPLPSRLRDLEAVIGELELLRPRWSADAKPQQWQRIEGEVLPSLLRRATQASQLEQRSLTGSEARVRWQRARQSIGEIEGIDLTPQLGLLPLGRDPDSGHYLFAHLLTGEPPRLEDGQPHYDASTGVVLVLLPGGTFLMGASADEDAHNFDPQARPIEGPEHAVTLDPFLLSKFELTRAQWERLAHPEKATHQHESEGLTAPITNVSWREIDRWLGRGALSFPSEAQWEYACRAGGRDRWHTGPEREALEGSANLVNLESLSAGCLRGVDGIHEWPHFRDPHPFAAPVYSSAYEPNDWGFHHMHGNAWELCLDDRLELTTPPRTGDGARVRQPRSDTRMMRGGAYHLSTRLARTADRSSLPADLRYPEIGVRPARAIDP